jgi:hypothetical protein
MRYDEAAWTIFLSSIGVMQLEHNKEVEVKSFQRTQSGHQNDYEYGARVVRWW